MSLALLAGCGRATSRNATSPKATYGQGSCDYVANSAQRNLGNFDMQLVQTRDPKMYALIVTPVALAQVGDLISITVSGEAAVYRELVTQVRLVVGRPVQAGILTVDELEKYSNIIIAQYQPGVSPLESTAKLVNICPLVQPGDNVAVEP
jgi:hypothetical protein